MTGYIIRRLVYSVVVVAGVLICVFIVTFMLGDPARMMLPLEATDLEVQAFRHAQGWDRPMLVQFMDFCVRAVRLDFGQSIWLHDDALKLVVQRTMPTAQLVTASMLLATLIAVPLGIIAALKPQSTTDRVVTIFSFVGISVPDYFLMIVLILVFAMNLHWAKSSGYKGLDPQYFLLPAIALAARPIGQIMIISRSSMMDELRKQYVITARAKGVREIWVLIRHTLKNALIPIITLGSWQLTRLIAGLTVAVESVAGIPGVGLLALDSIKRHDLPLLQANVFFVALLVTLLNLLVDVSYAYVDPRIRYD